jgi:hypothetical protein
MLHTESAPRYRDAMGQLLVLYTQVDRLIMLACAERIATAPDDAARLGLAQQVGDESRHVTIQRQWMEQFGTDCTAVLSTQTEQAILAHFRGLDWLDFLTDMYLCVEALGSDAVEQIVPLADPGTRTSLRVPLQDELNHIAFGIGQLRTALASLTTASRQSYLARIPQRIDALTDRFLDSGVAVQELFEAVGADYATLCRAVLARKAELLQEVAVPLAA